MILLLLKNDLFDFRQDGVTLPETKPFITTEQVQCNTSAEYTSPFEGLYGFRHTTRNAHTQSL